VRLFDQQLVKIIKRQNKHLWCTTKELFLNLWDFSEVSVLAEKRA
jgi:hypothetical protein